MTGITEDNVSYPDDMYLYGLDGARVSHDQVIGESDFDTIVTNYQTLVGLVCKLCADLLLCFEVIEVLQEQQPRGLLDVVQFVTTPCLIAQNVV